MTVGVLSLALRRVALALMWLWRWMRGEKEGGPPGIHDIPGPWPSLPFIGTSWQYWPGSRYRLDALHLATADKFRRWGRICREEFEWGRPCVHLFDPADFERVLGRGGSTRRPPQHFLVHYRRARPQHYESAGLANEEGCAWSKLRRAVGPLLLKPRSLDFLGPPLNLLLDDLVSLLRHQGPGLDFHHTASRFALEGAFLLSLDCRLGCLESAVGAEAGGLISAVGWLFEAFQELYYAPPTWKWGLPTPAYHKLARAEDTLYNSCSRRIREVALSDSESGVLRSLLRKGELSEKEIIVTVIDLIAGGLFTVAASLVFLLYHVARNPAVQRRLHAEIERHMPDDGVSPERISRMPYVRACVKEAFRLTPTIPCITRILTEDTELSGYNVPAGTTVFCNFPVPCSDPSLFRDPDLFLPERWMEGGEVNPFTLVPFGYGARMCVGKTFAEMEMYAALVKLVYHFEVEYSGPPVESKSAFILVPSTPVHLTFRDRGQ